MSGAPKLQDEDQKTPAEQVEETADEATESDRRHHPDSKVRDRRVIARFNAPEMRVYGRQIYWLCSIWVAFSALYIVGLGTMYAIRGVHEGTRSLFTTVVVASLAFCVHRVGRAAKSYLENESQARVATMVERLFNLMLVLLVLTVILGTAHLITLI